MNSIYFIVPGPPQGKARARTFYNPKTKHMSSITPEKTVLYENLVSTSFLNEAEGERFTDTDSLCVRISAYYGIPKSASKKRHQAMIKGEICPNKKPDIDNVAKTILDALNGIAYHDDTQVAELHVRKRYSDNPRVEVCIQIMDISM